MTGVVTRVFSAKGFAFVRGEDRQQRFIFARSVVPVHDFDLLREGLAVSFVPVGTLNPDPRAKNNGLRAEDVKVER